MTLYALASVCVAAALASPLLARLGRRRLERDRRELQALVGEVVSELRADAYFRSR